MSRQVVMPVPMWSISAAGAEKQVEVYRGARSALYGSGATGAVVALPTKDASDFPDPGERFGARLKGGLTDKSYRRHFSLIDETRRNFKVSASYR